MDDFEVPESVSAPPDLHPCEICQRKFVESTLVRHMKICEKNALKKRKVFNSVKQRTAGTDANTVPKTDPKKFEKAKKQTSNWRYKHEELVSTLRSARGVTHAMKTGAPLPPPPSQTRVNPDYVKCPSCDRNFSESAAERHIPWCKEKNKRISSGGNKKAVNKDKVAARTQYKPPLPGAKKRQIVPPKAGPALRTGKTGAGKASGLEDQYRDMSLNDKPSSGQGRTRPAGRGMSNGSKARSASLERRLEKPSPNYRSSSGDSTRGKSSPNSRTPTPPTRTAAKTTLQRKSSRENVQGSKASKFCPECGTPYPVPQAKFCCECGTRRPILG